jgi:hypothetical protein
MVPRGGIELSSILLNWRHFWNGGFSVYPSMYPPFNSHAYSPLRLHTGSAGPFIQGWMTRYSLT